MAVRRTPELAALEHSVTVALIDHLSVPPLHFIIAEYAEFVGRVITVAGGSPAITAKGQVTEYRDIISGGKIRFDQPYGLCIKTHTNTITTTATTTNEDHDLDPTISLLVAEVTSGRFISIDLPPDIGHIRCGGWAGAGPGAATELRSNTHRLQSSFINPYCITPDTAALGCYFLGENSSIHYCNGNGDSGGHVSLFAGHAQYGLRDGIGPAARFDAVVGLACTGNGKLLYIADYANDAIRVADIATADTKTLIAALTSPGRMLESPRQIAFDPKYSDDSVLFVTASESLFCITVTTTGGGSGAGGGSGTVDRSVDIKRLIYRGVNPYGLAFTPSRTLIMTCLQTESIYAVDPDTARQTLLAGPGLVSGKNAGLYAKTPGGCVDGDSLTEARMHEPSGLVLSPYDCSAYFADKANHRIRNVTLPRALFTPFVVASSASS